MPFSYLLLSGGRFKVSFQKLLCFRDKFFPARVVRHWTRLPRAVVESPSLERFKKV